jgi:hypothetical protein
LTVYIPIAKARGFTLLIGKGTYTKTEKTMLDNGLEKLDYTSESFIKCVDCSKKAVFMYGPSTGIFKRKFFL